MKNFLKISLILFSYLSACQNSLQVERRSEVSYLRAPYNTAFFHRHNGIERTQAAFHFHHAMQHDLLEKTSLTDRAEVDQDFHEKVLSLTLNKEIPIGPAMEFFGPYAALISYQMYRVMDWTHMHHEQTYDILSSDKIPWDKKIEWTEKAVNYYLDANPSVALSIAPVDITMRRAAVMMKPYFTFYRNYYPLSNGDAWTAHWWHPAIYEGLLLAGNDKEQELVLDSIDATLKQVFIEPPGRMLLSREAMPRYSRISPESANIFDNLHMLHGIIFDIFAYEGWNKKQKQQEIFRVLNAFGYQLGDDKYVRKFSEHKPSVDPKKYEEWMKTPEGEMSRIMEEMMDEMMPLMMTDGISRDKKAKMMDQFKKKMMSGMQPGEIDGSLHDAMMKIIPEMKMSPEAMKPGETPKLMVETMLRGWQQKYRQMPDIDSWPMEEEPRLSVK